VPELPGSLQRLIQEFSRLPGVGPKTAQRLAFHLLRVERQRVDALALAITELRQRIGFCSRCFNIAEGPLCEICAAGRRDQTVICVVETPLDLLAVERSGEYRGLYHVLHGVISPIDGVGPDDINIPQLVHRVERDGIEEVIIATNADIEGEATAVYLQKSLSTIQVRVSRPAHGLPMGGDLEYADDLTLARAMSGRRPF
jgi:recombination protein RecR